MGLGVRSEGEGAGISPSGNGQGGGNGWSMTCLHPGVTSLSHSPHNDPGQAGSRQAMLQRLHGIRVHDVPRHPLSQTGDHTCCQRAGYRNPPGWGSTL